MAPPNTKKEKKKIEKVAPPTNHIEHQNKNGKIKISEDVIYDVIRQATCSVEGVTKLSCGSILDSVASIIGSEKLASRAITFNIIDNALTAEVKVKVAYKGHIPEIATNIQDTVSKEIKRIIGLNVTKVDVIIQDIEYIVEIEEG